jgi:hypothetical protein
MQRTRLFTAWDGSFSLPGERALARSIVPVLFGLFALAAAAVLAAHPKPAIWDQARLLEARFEAPYHPAPPFGFTAQLAVIVVKALAPADADLNVVVRICAMLFWAGAATLLASSLLERRALVTVFLALLFTSQYPFLWFSTELVAGGVLCLSIASWRRAGPAWVTGVLLALLALCKTELAVVSLALLAYWLVRSEAREQRILLSAGFGLALSVLLLPGVLLFGPGYLTAYGEGSRGFATFAQHWAALVAPLQLVPGPDPWRAPDPYLARSFPGARSMLEVVTAPGLAYADFVALSAARGLRKVVFVANWALLALPPLVWARRRAGLRLDPAERTMLLAFVGCLPFVLFSYPHIRYFARYYPLFVILLLVSVERVALVRHAAARRRCLLAAGACIAASLASGAARTLHGLEHAALLSQYWFPD